MATAEDLDNEALLAQIEKEFEEEEKRKKDAKKAKKKGGKGAEETTESQQKPNDDAGAGDSDQVKETPQPAGHKKQDKKQKDKKKEGGQKKEDKENEVKEGEKAEATPKPDEEAKEGDKKKKKGGEQKPAAASKAAETKKPEPAETDASRPESAATEKAEPSGKDKKGAKGKKPSGALKHIKEALAKTKEIEDEIKRQEDEKERKAEEERQRQLEKERLEKEKKERKKQKEKERKEKLKQEGKYLTNKQKEQQKRAIIQLEALGIQVKKLDVNEEPGEVTTDQQKKPKFERKRKDKQETQTEEQAKEENEVKPEEISQQVETVVKEPKVKDNWFDESEEEEEEQPAQSGQKQQRTQSMSSEEVSDSEEESDEQESSEESEEEEDEEANLSPIEKAKRRIQKRHENAEKHRSTDNLRCPVICVLGHVDTGKTKILDNLRKTHVQEDEAGGITQQIGATNVPLETITERTKMCTYVFKNEIKVPGLLIIDTPGHESFKSLRTRGSSLCDIAILVVDIMHGLEPQTIESINILKKGKTPFLIALNKIDRLFEWKSNPNLDIQEVLKRQQANTRIEFEKRTTEVITQIAEQGLNARLFYENPDPRTYISMVPTSAHSSDGTGNLIALIIEFSQTILAKRVSYSNEIQCSVMEVKVIPSLGTTIDVCLVNGRLKVTDKIIVPGQEGPIETQIRGLLLPQPNRELRVKSNYVTHKEVQGARGIKIAARGLEKAMPGLPMFVAYNEDEVDYYKHELEGMLKQALSSIHLSDQGVIVQASTLGSLEALLEFLKTSKVPYSGIGIGPIHKKDVTKASIMLEKDPQWAVILAFDVKVERDAQELADNLGIRIFTADIIYHLFDKFIGYREELKKKKREEFKDIAVFPCKLKILPEFIFNTRDPIVVGVKVEAGFIKIGTPLVAVCEDTTIERESKDKFVDIGRITSIEFNHKQMEMAKTGNEVCIKIENTSGGAPKLLGRHFSEKDILASKISRESIDAVKEYFRDEMTKSDWQLIIDLKKQFNIL